MTELALYHKIPYLKVMALAEILELRGRNREVESSLPCLAAAAPGNGILMAANSKKVINFLLHMPENLKCRTCGKERN